MQEIIKLVSTIRQDIAALNSLILQQSKTHAQYLSEEWITKDQVMKLLKISPRTLETMKANGELPYSKIQGMIYFRTIDIENALNQHYVNPSASKKSASPKKP